MKILWKQSFDFIGFFALGLFMIAFGVGMIVLGFSILVSAFELLK